MKFEFASAHRILFGPGTSQEVPGLAQKMGQTALLVTGSNSTRYATLFSDLDDQGITIHKLSIAHEPSIENVQEGALYALEKKCDLVIAVGGGSVLDAGKAVAALATNQKDIFSYVEGIGNGEPITIPPLPMIAVPTTSGTGSEVTKNAVLASGEHQVKVSLRSPLMFPMVAVIDPNLTHTLPPCVTANTGLDALTQVIEPFVSSMANPLTDAFCWEGIIRSSRSLLPVWKNGENQVAREDMAFASLMGGLALANAKLGAVHGFAGPIGGMFPDAPHGAVCGRLLPYVTAVNIRALRERDPNSAALQRYYQVAKLLTGDPNAYPEDGAKWLEDVINELEIPGLGSYGITLDAIPTLIEKSVRSSSIQGSPISLTFPEMTEILMQAI